MRPTTIYALIDPRTEEVRYVGKTAERLSRRIAIHKRGATRTDGARESTTHCSRWLRGIYAAGLAPKVLVLEVVPDGGDWIAAEQRWIATYKQTGRLTNITSGGEGLTGFKRSQEFSERMSRLNAGKRMSDEARTKMSQAWTPERRAEHSARVRGRKASDESRAKMRAGQAKRVGRRFSVRVAPYAPLSPETKAKLSLAQKAAWARRPERKVWAAQVAKERFSDPASIAKMAAAKRGRPATQKQLECLALGRRLRHQ